MWNSIRFNVEVVCLSAAICINAALPGQAAAQSPTTVPVQSVEHPSIPTDSAPQTGPRAERFMQRHDLCLKSRDDGPIDLLFLGDSITEGWEWRNPELWKQRYAPLHAANFGVSADKTQNVIWRITDGGEIDGLHPKVVVLMIGTNNMGGDPPDAITAGVTKIVRILRDKMPTTKILLLGIFPRSNGGPTIADEVVQVNEPIAKLDDGKAIRYLDLRSKFLNADGAVPKEIFPDGLHPNTKGYEIWADAMQPMLDQMMK